MNLEQEIIDCAAQQLVRDIDNEIIWSMQKESNNDWFLVQIPWRLEPQDRAWTEACAWAMDQFGLPGDRYVTHPSGRSMEFLFRDHSDAVLMSLKWL
jgi:hypothetical protein